MAIARNDESLSGIGFRTLLMVRGLLSLAVGAHALAQNSSPVENPNPSIFQLQHTAWTEREGAPPAINDISQAPDGSLWLGSGEGLYRFDGFTFERVRAIDGDSPAPTEVYTLLATTNGDLWIGTSFNGAILLRNGVAKRFPKFEGIPLNTTIWGFAKDSDGIIWAATASGLQRFDGAQWRSVGKAWGVPEMAGYSVRVDSDGTLWAEAFGHGLFRLKRGLRHFERLADSPHENRSRENLSQENLSFNQSPSGEYWASTSSGICPLAEVLNGTAGPHCVVHDNRNLASPYSAVSILTFDRRGNLWTRAVGRGGIRRVDAAAFRDAFHPGRPEGRVESFTRGDGLTSDVVQSIFRDRRDGSIWVGTDHGLDHFREPSFIPVVPKPGVASFGIQAQKDGRVWISSIDRGGLWIASPEGETERVLPEISIQSLYETPLGTLWFATYSPLTIGSIKGPPKDRPKEGKIAELPLTPELQSQVAVQSIVEDRAGAVWASFIPYGLARWEGGHWTRNGGLAGLPEAWVVILNTGPDGKLWAGYLNGEAAVIDGASVRRFSVKDGLNIGPVAAILSGRADCWLAGVNGLVRFDGQGFHVLSEANNTPFSGITGIAEARNGDLWLNSWEGVRHIAAAELREAEKNPAYAVRSERYDLTDGLPSVPQRIRPFPTAVSASDGRIWFGLRAGVVSVDPEDPGLSTPVPPVSIVRAIADGKTYNAAVNARLDARTKNLEIDYTAVSLNRASRVRFRYKLEGVDTGWQNAGSRRQAFYNNLPPGRHRFVVSASNGDSLWNEAGATMNMEVPPAFNQTIWFRASLAAIFVAILWGLYRLRLYQVAREFSAQTGERARIARDLHDTLLQSFHASLIQMQTARNVFPLRPDEAIQTLDNAIGTAEQAIDEGRGTIQDLRTTVVPQSDLERLLTIAGQELVKAQESNGTQPVFRARVQGSRRTLSPILHDEVYRIGREALRNAFRHAHASHIEVEIIYDHSDLRLRIRDDGKGIDRNILHEGARAGHWGLPGARERAKRIGGRFDIWSESGAGTEIELTVPASRAYAQPQAQRRFGLFRKKKDVS